MNFSFLFVEEFLSSKSEREKKLRGKHTSLRLLPSLRVEVLPCFGWLIILDNRMAGQDMYAGFELSGEDNIRLQHQRELAEFGFWGRSLFHGGRSYAE